MYKLLIFDWDGTVIDSQARIVSSMQSAARDLELGELTAEAVRDIIGLGLPEAIRILIPSVSDEDIIRMRERYGHYFLGVDQTPTELFEGVAESLERLHQQGYLLAVATGKSRRGLNRAFAQTGLEPLFVTSRCADETASKPDPRMLNEILVETGIPVEQALMIGDTEYDLGMAVNAGMKPVGVSYGVHSVDRLAKYDPLLIMDRFSDLETWLEAQRS